MKAFKIVALGFILLILKSSSFGQTTNQSKVIVANLMKQANDYAKLIQKKDTILFIEKIYPKLIDKIGGKEMMMEMICKGYSQLAEKGISIDSIKFLNPKIIIDTAGELQTTMSEIIVMSIPNGKMVTKSTLIAISQDKGITWYLLDTNGNDIKTMRASFENLSSKLHIAPKEKPVVFRN